MDHRWRTNYQSAANLAAMQHASAQASPQPTHHTADAHFQMLSAEVAHLRSELAQQRASQSNQIQAIRQDAERRFQHHRSNYLAEIERLGRELETAKTDADASKQTRQDLEKSKQDTIESTEQLKIANTQLAEVQAKYDAALQQVAELKTELSNAASAAESELNQQRAETQSALNRDASLIAKQANTIDRLSDIIKQLQVDHEAVELINANLDEQIDQQTADLIDLQHELDVVVAAQLQQQQASRMELANLEHELHSTAAELRNAKTDNQESLTEIEILREHADQFDASLFAKEQEIAATQKLVSDLQRQMNQLRAEGINVSAANERLRQQLRVAEQATSELEQSLSEQSDRLCQAESTVGQRDQQLRELQTSARAAEANALLRASEAEQQFAVRIEQLEAELAEAKDIHHRDEHQEQVLKQQITDSQSQHQSDRERLRLTSSECDRLQKTIESLNQRLNEYEATISQKDEQIQRLGDTLQEELRNAEQNEQQKQQSQIEVANRRSQLAEYADRLACAQNHVVALQERIRVLEAEVAEGSATPQDDSGSQPVDTIKETSAESVTNDRSEIIDQYERKFISIRERGNQKEVALQRRIDSMDQQLRDLASERLQLIGHLAMSEQQIRLLQVESESWSVDAKPIEEARRLSAELAATHSAHAIERQELYWRIEQLHKAIEQKRAA